MTGRQLREILAGSRPNDMTTAPPQAPPPQPLPDEGAPLDLRALFETLWGQKWVILAVAAAVATAVTFYTLRQPRIYAATAVLEYDPNPPRPLGREVEDVAMPVSNFWLTREFYETQNRVISSRTVAERVVRKLGLHHDPGFVGVPEDERDDFEGVAVEEAAQALQGRITVEPIKDTRLVHIKVEDRDPERATLLANAIADAYIEKTLEDRLGSTVSALEWLSNQLDNLKRQLETSELALHEFKRENDVLSVSLEDRQNIVANDIQRYSESLTEARTRGVELRSRLAALRAANAEDPMSVNAAVVTQDPGVSALRASYRTKSAEREALATRYGAEHPRMQALDQELESIRTQMREAIDGLIGSVENELGEVERTQGGLRDLLEQTHQAGLELNLQSIQYSRLQRETENNAKLYELVLQRTTETDLTRMLEVAFVRMVDRAVEPKVPVKPRVQLNIAVGLLAGLLLGVGAGFLRTRLDRRVRSAEDVEALGLTVLGLLPAIGDGEARGGPVRYGRRRRRQPVAEGGNKDLVVHTHPMSAVAESCRTIRTNLTFMGAGKSLRTLVVTSPGPRDGKTTVALSLAIAMAQSGKRTLIVDTDLRRPRVHRTFGLSLSVGATSVLVGEKHLEEAVQETEVPGLFVLPCGPIPPNPSELLHSDGFRQLIERACATFDRVIFDSPPIGAVTDPAVIAPQVDGVLVVLKPDKTMRDSLAAAVRQLGDVGANVLGAVLNDVDLSRRGYGYGYYYYYGKDGDYRSPPEGGSSGNGHAGGRGSSSRGRDDGDEPRASA